ncbi:unnamed protein product, partial [Phaeothamnion confervicola]
SVGGGGVGGFSGSGSGDDGKGGSGESCRWTCCGATSEDAPGCMAAPHVPKEMMVSIRARGGPPVLVGSQRVSVFQHLEMNIFPSTQYRLAIQMTRGVAMLLRRYFCLE